MTAKKETTKSTQADQPEPPEVSDAELESARIAALNAQG